MRKLVPLAAVVAFLSVFFTVPGTAAAVDYQRWRTIEITPTDMCIGVSGGQMVNGAKVILWPCSGATDQSWVAIPTDQSGGYHQIRNKKDPSKCLSVLNSWKSPGVQLIIWTCQNAYAQQWDAVYVYDGWVELKNRNSGLYAAISGGNAVSGAPIIQWTRNFGDEQTWEPIAG